VSGNTLRHLLGDRFLDSLSPHVCIDLIHGTIWHTLTGQQFAVRDAGGWRMVKQAQAQHVH
jgi:hypothetical protein